jgi:hypothetical protein
MGAKQLAQILFARVERQVSYIHFRVTHLFNRLVDCISQNVPEEPGFESPPSKSTDESPNLEPNRH